MDEANGQERGASGSSERCLRASGNLEALVQLPKERDLSSGLGKREWRLATGKTVAVPPRHSGLQGDEFLDAAPAFGLALRVRLDRRYGEWWDRVFERLWRSWLRALAARSSSRERAT